MTNPLVAPREAWGWTHVWDGTEQLAISDEVAGALVFLGIVHYSPEDGPRARVYRPNGEWTCALIRSQVLRDM